MKKRLLMLMVLFMVFALLPGMPGKSEAKVTFFQPDVSDKLINSFTDIAANQTVDVVIWANKPIDSELGSISQSFTSHPKFGCYVAKVTKSEFESLQQLPEVSRITENYKISAPQVKVSEPEEVTNNWGLDDLGIRKLWDKGITGKGVTVGLLDTGVDAEHPALKGKIDKFVMFQLDGTKVDSKPFDNVGHGTHCAGIICGSDPKTKNGPGVAPDAKLIVGSVLPNGNGMFAQVLGGMEWILDPDGNPKTDDAPPIVSMSLGGIPDPDMTKIADMFQRQGVMLVSSIGNDGAGVMGSPGSIPSVFSVGSYDKDRRIAYSSGGGIIDWEMDPYHDITVTKPDISAPGVDVYSCFPGGEYVELSGTSMACPHVAASSALLLSADKNLTNNDLANVLSKTADDLGKKGWDIRWGNGAINVNKAYENLTKLARLKVDVSEKPEEPVVIKINDRIYRTDRSTEFMLDPGDANITVSSFGCATVDKKISLKAGTPQTLAFDATKLPTVTYKGTLVGVNGENAIGTIKIAGAPKVYTTDEEGDFEITLPKMQFNAEFWAIGFKTLKTAIDLTTNFEKVIELKPAKILVATSQLATPNSSFNRRFDKYCYKAMDDLGIEYCPVNPREFKVTYDMMKGFDRVYWFAGEASLKVNDANTLHKYLLNGGKLLLSGRNLLYYEVYRRDHNFTQYHFQVRAFPDDTYTTTSVGIPKDEIGDGLALSLSGGDGATNQIGYDTFSPAAPAKNVIPFMAVLTPSDRALGDYGYSGVRIISPTYLGVYLSFGIEGIGNNEGRKTLLQRINNWFDSYGGVNASFVDDKGKPVFAKVSIEGLPDNTTDDDGNLILYYLPKGQVTLKVSAVGYDDQTFKADITEGKTNKVQFQLANPKTITITGQVTDADAKAPMSCQIKVYGKDAQTFKTDDKGKFSITLPKFAYSFKFYKKGYINVNQQYTDNNDKVAIQMVKSPNPVAFVQQVSPSWEPMAFAGITQTYERIARESGYNLESISIRPDQKIEAEDLEQYQSLIWYCGFNDEVGGDWWFDAITKYVKGGGKLALIGAYVPTALNDRPELAKLLGLELDTDDTQIYTVMGVAGDPISDGLLYSLWHPYLRQGFIAQSPSMKPVGKGISCFNLPGSSSAAIRVKSDKQTTLVMAFGFEQLFTSRVEDNILFKRIVDYLK